MGRIRFFANPESSVTRRFMVTDPDGSIDPATGKVYAEEHFVELRTELSDKEWSDLDMGVVTRATTDGELILDLSSAAYHHMATWIRSWSLTSDAGTRVKPTEAQIGELLPAHAAIIWGIVKEHAAAVKAKHAADTDPTVSTTAGAATAGASETVVNPSLTLMPQELGASYTSDIS